MSWRSSDRSDGYWGEPGYWSQVGESWHRRTRDRLWRAHSDAVNARLLDRWCPAGGGGRALKTDLFDEAFGNGLIDWLIGRFAPVVGIDLSQPVLEAARVDKRDLTLVRCDVRALPFRDGSFDTIASISTLDHFPRQADLVASIVELRRVLSPAGVLILTLDNRANPVVGIRNVLPFRLVQALNLVPYYVGKTAGPWRSGRLLAEAGFEVLEVETLMHCPRVLAVPICRMLERWAWRGAADRFLDFLLTFERLSRWPTRHWTGHFVALKAVLPRFPGGFMPLRAVDSSDEGTRAFGGID